MKLLKIIFTAALLTLLTGEIFRIDISNNIAFRLMDIMFFLCSVIFILLCIRYKKFPKSYLFNKIMFFGALAAASLFINSFSLNPEQLFVSGLYLARWIIYTMVFFIMGTFDRKFIYIIKNVLFIIGIIIVLLGYIQFFLYPNLRNLFYLGWDEHNYRMFSVFLDPNFAGAFFVLYFLFVSATAKDYLLKKKGKHAAALFMVSVLTIAAIFLTYSRSALLMLAAGSITYLVLIRRKMFLFAFLGAFAIIIVLLSPTFKSENTNLLRITSSLARVETYSNSIKIIKDHPFLGVGFNAYRYAQQSYGFRDARTQFPQHADAGVDNSFLFVAATTGVIGFGAYLYLWFSILKRAFYHYSRNNVYAVIIICSSLALFVNSFFINSFFFPAIMLWMWVLIGMMEKR